MNERFQIVFILSFLGLNILYIFGNYAKYVYYTISLTLTTYEYNNNFNNKLFYIYCLLSHISGLFNENIIQVILITQVSDGFQYMSGRYFGKNKNIISISPNKSLEGYLIGGYLTIMLFYFLDFKNVIMTVVAGIGGDLLVSYVKRKQGIKDSSTLLKSHGGWLDRIDSIMMASLINLFF